MEEPGWRVTALDVVDAVASERILGRVQGLPEITRRVVTMRKVYGMTQEQIADRLGMSPDAVMDCLVEAVRACADFGEIADA
jgi:DNA-directed RNA polymerase specialized sigma24 family protein